MLNVGRRTKISPRHVILYKPALFSLSPRTKSSNYQLYSLRVDTRSPQHNVAVKLHCEHDTVISISRNVPRKCVFSQKHQTSATEVYQGFLLPSMWFHTPGRDVNGDRNILLKSIHEHRLQVRATRNSGFRLGPTISC